MPDVLAEIDVEFNARPNTKACIRVDWGPEYIAPWVGAVKKIAGNKFIPKEKGGPAWRVPLELDACRRMREFFEGDLKVGPLLAKWYLEENKRVNSLIKLSSADKAELEVLPNVLPELYDFVATRPYQLADIKFMAQNPHPGNFNHPGTGKTVETIASVFEAGMEEGPQLVVAPVTSLDVVWQFELERWQPYPVLVARGGRQQRELVLAEAMDYYESGMAFWLVVNPAMIRYQRVKHKEVEGEEKLVPTYQEFFHIRWKTKILDEFHKCGLGNTSTLTYKAMVDVPAEKSIGISGTPMGGKPIKMFGVLSYLDSKTFSSKWKWADQWLNVTAAIGKDGQEYGQRIEGIKEGREDDFTRMLSQYAVRRTKAEVAPELPNKLAIDIWVNLEGEQLRQYKEFEKLAAIKIADEEITATSILAEYTRLKQFADAVQDVKERPDGSLTLKPVAESAKLGQVERILNEIGIDPHDPEGEEKCVIFSQFSMIVDMVTGWLLTNGYPAAKLTGATPTTERAKLVRDFQDPKSDLKVLVITTTAGGVSITLDLADTVIFLDETYVPDDQEQAADRLHRVSRIHQVTMYYLRAKGTIEEYIQNMNLDKQMTNDQVLDVRRKLLGIHRVTEKTHA